MKITISVIVATYNRAKYLDQLLDSICRQKCSGFLEIVIVDNNSTDECHAIFQKWHAQSPVPIFYFLELKPGVSHARNRGVHVAKGNIVVFIDDDALADPDWLSNLTTPYRESEIWQGGGGKVLLAWGDLQRPKWLTHLFLHTLSYFELPYQDLIEVTQEKDFVIGCNLSFRRDTFLQLGGFNPNLGRIGNSLQEGEESDLQRKIMRLGGKLFYHPKAVVHHAVIPSKITKRFFYRFYLGKALTMLRNYQSENHAGTVRSFCHFAVRIPVWFFRTLSHLHQPDQRFYCWLQMVMNLCAALYCLNPFTN